MAKLPQTPGSSGFGDRLSTAMDKARSGQAQAAEEAAQLKSPASDNDDFTERLSQAMAKARGEEPATEEDETPAGEQQALLESTGPAGTGGRVIRAGDCITSIAKETGHFWETIWDDPGNSELRSARVDPNVLLPGDRVHVPELRRKDESGQTENRHRFRRKGEPAFLRLRIVKEPELEEQPVEDEQTATGGAPDEFVGGDPDVEQRPREDEPRANVPYALEIDGEQHTGTTDEDGRIEIPIPGNARRGKLTLNPGSEDEEVVPFQLGSVDPLSEIRGIKERLTNLAFDCGDEGDEATPELADALRRFQQKRGLEMTGEPDQATRAKLREVHGS